MLLQIWDNQIAHSSVNRRTYENHTISINFCGCGRVLQNVSKIESLLSENTCSYSSFQRGPHQKIIGYSIYGDLNSKHAKVKGYFEGIQGNLELLTTFYPGWTLRLYHEIKPNTSFHHNLCSLWCQFEYFDLCNITEIPNIQLQNASKMFPMNWRYFPTLDPQVSFITKTLSHCIL